MNTLRRTAEWGFGPNKQSVKQPSSEVPLSSKQAVQKSSFYLLAYRGSRKQQMEFIYRNFLDSHWGVLLAWIWATAYTRGLAGGGDRAVAG